MKRVRLDVLLHQRGLAPSREKAKRLIQAGQVRVNGRTVDKVATPVEPDVSIEIIQGLPYVSRGGYKLAHALDVFGIDPRGCVAVDVGASTGGFTDCMLQRGAGKVYAVDVGYGQLDWRLRQDERVVVMERVNARYLERLPEPVDLATIDVSFISLRLVLPRVYDWLREGGYAIALIKPQFEAGRRDVGKKGIVRDVGVHRRVLTEILDWAQRQGWRILGLTRSPIKGAKGNQEFLVCLAKRGGESSFDVSVEVEKALLSERKID